MGGVTWAVLVGTKVCAQYLEKPETSTPGRPGLGLTLNFPTLAEFPPYHPWIRPGSQEQSPRSLSPGPVGDKLHC